MNAFGLVVIGSGPAGVSAAEAFREHDPEALIRIMTTDPDLPYARPPLSKEYLRGETEDVSMHDRDWFDERSIEIHRGRVTSIDLVDQAVLLDGEPMPYGALVLACGATPTPLPVAGGDRALLLRSFAEATGSATGRPTPTPPSWSVPGSSDARPRPRWPCAAST